MNVIEAAKAAGILPERDETFGKVYEVEEQQLERFAQIIRNQALEDAAKACDDIRSPWGYSAEKADWIRGTDDCAAAIRAMKKEPQ